jgi:hypothetical protein
MTIFTTKSGQTIDLDAGIEQLQTELTMLRAYKDGYVNSGLESMDYPAGNLIESGLAAKYPELFKVGAGIEGIDSLITKLSNGLEGLTILKSQNPEAEEVTGNSIGKAENVAPPEDGSVVIDKPVETPDVELQPQNPDA